ncbi:diguanylate cyclase/phosphodiesterase (GGDEF & EAL domains) with PAS/PAC sensor [Hydrogenimonas sp.]|nr:diguanylate cyclase/phosphodiesterase (GGDEF & EAL domains) with PAS/PAC sensor [Hydrogenimonas sp.]
MEYFLKDCEYKIVINPENGKIIECNKAYSELVGYSKDEIFEQALLERMTVENTIMFLEVLDDVIAGTKAMITADHNCKNGEKVRLDNYLISRRHSYIEIWMKKNRPPQLPIHRRRLLDMIIDYAPDMFWAKDLQGRYLFTNKALCEKLLDIEDQRDAIGKTDIFFALRQMAAHPENPSWYTMGEMRQNSDELVIKHLTPMHFEEHGKVKGKEIYLDVHKAPLYNCDGVLIGTVGIGRDITLQKEFETKVEEEQLKKMELFESLLNSTIEGLLIFDENRKCIHYNSPIKEIFGYSDDELWQKDALSFAMDSSKELILERYPKSDKEPYEVLMKRRDGSAFWALVRGKFMTLEGKKVKVWAIVDISPLKEKERAITFQAEHDPLTNLINRRHFFRIFESVLESADRKRQYKGLLFIDLDRFKPINDTMGHNIGDQLLQLVAQRLQSSLRKSDLISRFGGDEFLALISTETTDIEDAKKRISMIAEKILRAIKAPYRIEDKSVEIGASIGITVFNSSERDLNRLILDADSAMYEAKKKGGNSYSFSG